MSAIKSFHSPHDPLYPATRDRGLYRTFPPCPTKGVIPYRSWLKRLLSRYLRFNGLVRDYLRRHILEQVVAHCQPEPLYFYESQPDGAQDVLLSRAAPLHRDT